jgi:Tissue inhibitor of metalloproteinase
MSLRSSVKLIILTILLLFSFSANPEPILACTCECKDPGTVLQRLDKSHTVFAGKVVNVVEISKGIDFYNDEHQIDVTFQVSKVWKGSKDKILTISNHTGCCGDYPFDQNDLEREYLIYAGSNSDGRLFAGSCGNTQLLVDVQADVAILGSGQIPSIEPQTLFADSDWFLPWIGIGIVSLGIIAIRLKISET